MVEAGLSLIAIAWLLQFLSIVKKENQRLSIWFVLLYIAGSGILTLDGYKWQVGTPMILNLITLFAALLVLQRLVKKY